MKVKLNYLKYNLLYLLTGIDTLYVIVFYILYLILNQEKIGLIDVIGITLKQPALFLLLIHPIIFYILINNNRNRANEFLETNKNKWQIQNKKINEIYQFIEELRTGTTQFEFSEEFKQDKLVKSLNNFKNELEITRQEDEKRKKEEQQRHWINEGLAKFGAILRENVDDLEKLANEITSNLVKYMKVEQSGFFVIKEEEGEKFIDMLSLYAFDRKKFPDKKFQWGEGLIGACAIEQKTIFIKEASDSFVDITTGLGKANPRSILIVPIKDNSDNVHGVLELASFKIFADFEINFAEQVAESIGLTMASIKTNLTTQNLLQESQKQAELLAQQETNMRKNIEDITSELGEQLQTVDELQKIVNTTGQLAIYFELDFDKKIIDLNDLAAETLKSSSKSTFLEQYFSILLSEGDKIEFDKNFNQVIEEKNPIEIDFKFIDSENNYLNIKGKLVPALNEYDEMTSVVFVGFNFTSISEQLIDKNKIIDSTSRILLLFELDSNANIINVNEKIIEILGYQPEELLENKFIDIVAESDKTTIEENFKNKSENNLIQIKLLSKENKELYFMMNLKYYVNTNNKHIKTYISAIDINENQILEQKNKELSVLKDDLSEKYESLKNETEARINRLRKTIEDEFAVKEQKVTIFNQFLENIDKAVILIENEKIILFNSYAEKLWNHKKDVVIGKRISYLFPKDEEYISDKEYAGTMIEQNVKNKKCYILNKKYEKVQAILNVNIYEQNNNRYVNMFLDQ